MIDAVIVKQFSHMHVTKMSVIIIGHALRNAKTTNEVVSDEVGYNSFTSWPQSIASAHLV